MLDKIPETLEAAKEMLLQYSNDLEAANNTITTLNNKIAENSTTIEDLRTLNQRYYLQLAQGTAEPDNEGETEPKQTLEDYAKTLKGVFIK